MSVFPIRFFFEGVHNNLKERKFLKSWICEVVDHEGHHISSISFIFCADAFLSEMNRTYLHHHTLTDVITFDLAEPMAPKPGVEGEIYISLERVKENARTYHVRFRQELMRVMVHGTLHLLGYNDKTSQERLQMKGKEDFYLHLPSVRNKETCSGNTM